MVVKMSHNFFYCFHRKRIRDEKGGGGDQEKIKKEKKKSRSIEGRRAGEESRRGEFWHQPYLIFVIFLHG